MLTTIDITQNIQLERFYFGLNPISELDVTQNSELIELVVNQCDIFSLDVSQNILLSTLFCINNQLSSFDLSQNNQLLYFGCDYNQISYMDIRNGNNINISYFSAINNPILTCIFVDDKNYSENNSNWHKDPTSHFVETQAQCDALGIIDFEVHQVKIYPNPIRDKFHIEFMPSSNITDVQLRVIDLVGNKLLTTNLSDIDTTIDIHNFNQGIYFINIYNNNKIILTKKIIKL